MSIFKSQGSEYSSVIIPILSQHYCRLFTRNLLYTALTRAKERVTLISDETTISRMILQADTNGRKSLLAKRLQAGKTG